MRKLKGDSGKGSVDDRQHEIKRAPDGGQRGHSGGDAQPEVKAAQRRLGLGGGRLRGRAGFLSGHGGGHSGGARGGGTDSAARIGTPLPFRDLLISIARTARPDATGRKIQIEFVPDGGRDRFVTVTMPEWLAKDKGLI